MKFLNLRRLNDPAPRGLRTVRLFADADGALKTVQPDGTVADVGSSGESPGGSSPVGCVLYRSAVFDIHDINTYYVEWDTIYDNDVDHNELEALPAGIGLELGADSVTTTEAGVWALSLAVILAADATWKGSLKVDNATTGSVITLPVQTDVLNRQLIACRVLNLPAGTQLATAFQTVATATADPYNVSTVTLIIVRLG